MVVDTGIRYDILGSRNMDFGRVYENMVYIELLRCRIARTRHPKYSCQGIEIYDIADWLRQE